MRACIIFLLVFFYGTVVEYKIHVGCSDDERDETSQKEGSDDESDDSGSELLLRSERDKPKKRNKLGYRFKLLSISKFTPKSKPKTTDLIDLDIGRGGVEGKVSYLREGKLRCYKALGDYCFKSIKKRTYKFWDFRSGGCAKEVRLKGIKHEPKYLAIIHESGSFSVLYKSGKGSSWVDKTERRCKLSDLDLYTTTRSGDLKLDPESLKFDFYNFVYGYTVKPDSVCDVVRHKNRLLWSKKADPGFGRVKGVYLGLSSNQFILVSNTYRVRILDRYLTTVPASQPVESQSDKGDSEDEFEVEVSEDEEGLHLLGYDPVDPFDPSNPANYRKLDPSSYNLTQLNGVDNYEFKPGVKCVSIMLDGRVVWKLKKGSNLYPVSFSHSPVNNKFIVNFENQGKAYRLINSEWVEVESTKTPSSKFSFVTREAITMDVLYARPSKYFDFTARGGFGFYDLKPKYGATIVLHEKELIWKSSNPEEFVKRVVISFVFLKSCDFVSLFMHNGDILHFKRVGDKWVERRNSVALDINKTDFRFDYWCELFAGKYHYSPRFNIVFDKVLEGKEVIWHPKSKSEFVDKVTVEWPTLENRTHRMVVRVVGGKEYHFYKKDDKWYDDLAQIGINFDFEDKQRYTVEKAKYYKTIDPKVGMLIDKVEADGLTIWKAKNEGDLAVWARKYDVEGWSFIVVVKLNERYEFFYKPKDDEWYDVTKAAYDFNSFQVMTMSEISSDLRQIRRSECIRYVSKYSICYKFKKSTPCYEVRLENQTIWTFFEDIHLKPPKCFCLNFISNKAYLNIGGKTLYLSIGSNEHQTQTPELNTDVLVDLNDD